MCIRDSLCVGAVVTADFTGLLLHKAVYNGYNGTEYKESACGENEQRHRPVSYTHLDVYKRQALLCLRLFHRECLIYS